ncbi:hypothetical protein H0H93_002232 [Arthromyces matolae]|nr:hypothetical protein H0H93_002232 [Arthromyces matolae]
MDAPTHKNIIVIGAGVIGLTTAITIQEQRGHMVTIVAELLPSDPKSPRYASHWAGAHHVSLATSTDSRQQEIDLETFKIMWETSAPGCPTEHCFLRMTHEEYHRQEKPKPDVHSFMPDFREPPREAWPEGAVHGAAFTTLTVDTPVFLDHLMSRFIGNGGAVVRGTVQHISELIEGGVYAITGQGGGPVPPDAIIVCAGLGARTLGGVEDHDLYPLRGQTVLLKAPWIRFGRTLNTAETGTWTYIIPRKYPRPRPETTRDILNRALSLAPELAPPEIRDVRPPSVEDLLPIVIEEGYEKRHPVDVIGPHSLKGYRWRVI